MITKAIIEYVEENQVSSAGSQEYTSLTVFRYKVRIPIFHGYKDADKVASENLPYAVCVTLPHMEEMQYRVNDVVYVAIEDFDLSNIVILGMVPVMQQKPLTGANNTQAKFVVKDAETFLMNKQGSAELPADTKIYMDAITNPYYIRNGKNNYVTGTEISMLKGVQTSINDSFSRVNNSISSFTNRFQVGASLISYSGVTNCVLDSTTWVEHSGFIQAGYKYEIKRVSSTSGTDVWTVTADGKNYTFTKDSLQNECGISYSYASITAVIRVVVSAKPLSYKYGGTSADNYVDARDNLGVFHDVVIHMDNYEKLESSGRLEPNTVYYIYNNDVEDT